MSSVIENRDAGKFWVCPDCQWEGRGATVDMDRRVVLCPDCETVLDDGLQRLTNGEEVRSE